MSTRTISCLALSCLLAMPAVAAAVDCSDDSNNLLANRNCDFDSDVSQFTALAGSAMHDTDGDPTAGSAEISAPPGQAGLTTPCYALPAASQGETTNFGVRVKPLSGVAIDMGCGVIVNQYDGANCTGTLDAGVSGGGPGDSFPADTWTLASGSAALNGDTVSFEVQFGCTHTGGAYSIRVDDVYLSPATVPVEIQSFRVE